MDFDSKKKLSAIQQTFFCRWAPVSEFVLSFVILILKVKRELVFDITTASQT
jgi:hypothetical protein